MPKFIDLSGQKFGRLAVRGFAGKTENGMSKWECLCDCGEVTFSTVGNLRNGSSVSCGCSRIKHGHTPAKSQSPTYHSWRNMIRRCTDPNNKDWINYGSRGISVCERWRKFANFLEDMGEKPDSMTIDRINNDGDYELNNCRWATRKEQNANRRKFKRKEVSHE